MKENKSGNILSAGSVDNKLATCAADVSNPSMSSGASSERSATSNPAHQENIKYFFRYSMPQR
jgi:hypothetical protein